MTHDKQPRLLLPVSAPYSKVLLQLCQRIKAATSQKERLELMVQLASRFHQEHDATDAKLCDDYHEYFEEYEEARLRFQQMATRLARLAMSEVEESVKLHDVAPEAKQAKPDPNVN